MRANENFPEMSPALSSIPKLGLSQWGDYPYFKMSIMSVIQFFLGLRPLHSGVRTPGYPIFYSYWFAVLLSFGSLCLGNFGGNFLYAREAEGRNVSNSRTKFLPKFLRSATNSAARVRANNYEANFQLKENTDVRIHLQKLFAAPLLEVLAAPQTIYSQRDGNLPVMFQVRLNNNQADKLYYAFINRTYDADGNIIYPVSSRGSYLIRRNLQQNRIDQIKIFLSQNIGNEQSFIRIAPHKNANGNKNNQSLIAYAKAEVVIFNRMIYSGVPLSVPFEDILTMPLHQFLQVTGKTIQWNNLISEPSLTKWQLVKLIPDRLRPYLYQIPEVYDGAMNVRGTFVRIETGEPLEQPGFNCSGFIKWVADGVYRSQKKWSDEQLYLDIEVLKRRQVEVRGAENPWNDSQEQARDPYFGLDWARAIAQQLLELEVKHPVDVRSSDVQDIPFFNYFENVGYPINNLNAMMYLLAVQNPGNFYLGAINGNFGEPPLHQYYHEVALFPYFYADGRFRLVVMDTGVERSEGFLETRYKDNYIHLSRVKAPYEYIVAPLNRQIGRKQ